MGGLLRKWGLGAELTFDASAAVREMVDAEHQVEDLKEGFAQLKQTGFDLGAALGMLALSLTPVALGFGAILVKSSALAQGLEAQRTTMRALIGDAAKADQLIESIRARAASTPFQEGDLIEGSKRLLRLTKQNLGANEALLETAMTMAALNPTKNVTDAVEGILDAASGGGFERLKEFGLSMRAEDFASSGRAGGQAWADAVTKAIGESVIAQTGGADLIGELSRTFGGRMSTLKDNVDQVFTGIGESLNSYIGPFIDSTTKLVQRLKGPVTAGAERFFGKIASLWERFGAPVARRMDAWLEGLGDEGVEALTEAALAFGLIASVFVAMAGVTGGLTAFFGAIVASISAIVGALSIPVLKATLATLLAVGAAAAGLVGIFKGLQRDGEGPLDTLVRIGKGVGVFLVGAFRIARQAGAHFLAGFQSTFQGIEVPAMKAQILFGQLATVFRSFVDRLGMSGVDLGTFQTLGELLGIALNFAVGLGLALGSMVVQGIQLAQQVLEPFLHALFAIGDAFTGLASGSLTFGQFLQEAIGGAAKFLLATLNALFVAILFAVEKLLGLLAPAIGILQPGASGAGLEAASVGIGNFRTDLSTKINDSISGVDTAAKQRERDAAAERDVHVNAEGFFQGKFDFKTCVDGEEIARSQGQIAVRNGEKGSGPSLPPEQRGRVLRHGLQITPLAPAEVL